MLFLKASKTIASIYIAAIHRRASHRLPPASPSHRIASRHFANHVIGTIVVFSDWDLYSRPNSDSSSDLHRIALPGNRIASHRERRHSENIEIASHRDMPEGHRIGSHRGAANIVSHRIVKSNARPCIQGPSGQTASDRTRLDNAGKIVERKSLVE